MESVRLDPELAARLKSAAASCRVTLFCALLAVLKAVLTLRTGGRDVVALSPIWNRSTEDRERLVGWAADMTAVRTDCGGDPSFRELARRVQRGVLDDMHHSRTPFEELVRRLSPELYGRFAPQGARSSPWPPHGGTIWTCPESGPPCSRSRWISGPWASAWIAWKATGT